MVLLNNANNISRNYYVFVRYSEIIRRVIVKNVQNVCLGQLSFLKPGRTKKLLGCGLLGGSGPRLTKSMFAQNFQYLTPPSPCPTFSTLFVLKVLPTLLSPPPRQMYFLNAPYELRGTAFSYTPCFHTM